MTNVIDLQAMVNTALTNMHQDGSLEKMITAQLEKTVKSVLDDAIGSYSGFGKELKEAVKSTLGINIDRMELPTYNVLVTNIIKDRLDQIVHEEGVEKMKQRLDEMFTPVKPEVHLSELIEEWKKALNEDGDRNGESITVLWEDSTYGGGGWLYVDADEDRDKYRCDLQVGVNKEDKVFALKWEGKDLTKAKTDWGINEIAEQFFRIYAAGSKLIVDMDEVYTNFGYDD